MQAALDAIDWAEIADHYGPAESIPDALIALGFGSADERRRALAQLWDGLCLERASLSEASAQAVPFLVDIASQGEGRGKVVELLHTMAQLAYGGDDEPEASTFRALRARLDTCMGWLEANDAELRARAAMLVAELADEPDESVGARLLCRFALESDALARLGLVLGLFTLGDLRALPAALRDEAYCVRLTAALRDLHAEAPSEPALLLVREALTHPAQSEAKYGRAVELAPFALVERVCEAGPKGARLVLPALLALLVDGVEDGASGELAALLDLFFPEGAPERPDLVQAALSASIARNRSFFAEHGSARGVLAEHGLPTRARPLTAYAQRGPRAHLELVPMPSEPGPPGRILAEARLRAGRDPLRRLDLVGVSSDALLALLAELPALRRLALKSAPVSCQGFASVARLAKLEVLELADLALDMAGARELARSTSLSSLTLADLTLGAGALAELAALPALEYLALVACDVSDLRAFAHSSLHILFVEEGVLVREDLRAIARLPGLRDLRLLTGQAEGLEALASASALEQLTLRGLDVAALGLPPQLQRLTLGDCQVAPEAFASLSACPALSALQVPRGLSPAQERALREALGPARLQELLPHLAR